MRVGIRRSRTRTLLTLVVVLMLTGCVGLPAPSSPSDTAFVLPVQEVIEGEEGQTFGYYEVIIRGIDDPNVRRVIDVYAGSEYEVISGLEPGEYRISERIFRYKSDRRKGTTRDLNVKFTLEAGTLTISPETVRVVLYKRDPDDETNWIGFRLIPTTQELRQRTIELLEEHDNFAAWEIAQE